MSLNGPTQSLSGDSCTTLTFQRVRWLSIWLSLSEQFELFVLTCPIMELCANVDVPFRYRLGFLSLWKHAGKSRVTPISGLGSLTLEFTGICFLYRESNTSYNRHLSMVMTASFYSSCPIMVVSNVPEPRNL